VASHRGDTFAVPAVAVARLEPTPIERRSDRVILHDEGELTHGLDDVGRRAVSLPPPAAGQAMLGMSAPYPVNDKDDLSRIFVDIDNGLVDHCPDNALLQPCVGCRRRPDSTEILGQVGEGDRSGWSPRRRGSIVLGYALLDRCCLS
jgi:hypothetical protein